MFSIEEIKWTAAFAVMFGFGKAWAFAESWPMFFLAGAYGAFLVFTVPLLLLAAWRRLRWGPRNRSARMRP